jgi:hypothetical protein
LGLTPQSPASLIGLPALGGLIIGAIAIAAPLTIGNGSVPLSSVMADGYAAYWSRTRTGFVNAFCATHDCMGSNVTAEMAQLYANGALQTAQYENALHSGWPNPAPEDRVYSDSLLVGTLFLKMVSWAAAQVRVELRSRGRQHRCVRSCGLVGGSTGACGAVVSWAAAQVRAELREGGVASMGSARVIV